MSDYINRRAAIDAVNGMPDCPNGYSDTYDKAHIIAVLEDVPSVQTDMSGDMSGTHKPLDCISRQAAIEIVERYDKSHMALKQRPMLGAAPIVMELEELPSAQPEHTVTHSCDSERTETHDLVSRRAVMAKLNMLNDGALYTHADYVDAVRSIPTVEPQRMRGKWIHDGCDIPHGVDWMHCSVCGRREPHVPAAMTNYCPNCGADMRGTE